MKERMLSKSKSNSTRDGKEMDNKISAVLGEIKLDKKQDEMILDQLLSFNQNPTASNLILFPRLERIKQYKIVIAAILIVVIGGGSVLASDILFKSDPIPVEYISKDEFIRQVEYNSDPSNRTVIQYESIDRKIYKTVEQNMRSQDNEKTLYSIVPDMMEPTSIKEYTYDTIKSLVDATFIEAKMVNIIPTYFYENYYISNPGVIYDKLIESQNGTQVESNSISMLFHKYIPNSITSGDVLIRYNDFKYVGLTEIFNNDNQSSLKESHYVTKSGIHCWVESQNKIDAINELDSSYSSSSIAVTPVIINFEHELYGEGSLELYFYGYELDLIKEVLETIPYLAE